MIRLKPILVVFALLVSLFASSRVHAVYNAQTGRYLQADPNAMGIPVLTNLSWHSGESPAARVQKFNARLHFADGGSGYEYVRSSPMRRFDPMGLSSGTPEMAIVGGIGTIVQGLIMAGISGASSIMGGLATSTGVWVMTTAANGALVVGYNYNTLAMMMSDLGSRDWTWEGTRNQEGVNYQRGGGGGEPRVLQTGGHTLQNGTIKDLGMSPDQGKNAIEGFKSIIGQGNADHSHKIWSNGFITDSNTGKFLGDLWEHIH